MQFPYIRVDLSVIAQCQVGGLFKGLQAAGGAVEHEENVLEPLHRFRSCS